MVYACRMCHAFRLLSRVNVWMDGSFATVPQPLFFLLSVTEQQLSNWRLSFRRWGKNKKNKKEREEESMKRYIYHKTHAVLPLLLSFLLFSPFSRSACFEKKVPSEFRRKLERKQVRSQQQQQRRKGRRKEEEEGTRKHTFRPVKRVKEHSGMRREE